MLVELSPADRQLLEEIAFAVKAGLAAPVEDVSDFEARVQERLNVLQWDDSAREVEAEALRRFHAKQAWLRDAGSAVSA